MHVSAEAGYGDRLISIYLRLHEADHSHSKELAGWWVIADYDLSGRMIGVEILGPCSVDVPDEE